MECEADHREPVSLAKRTNRPSELGASAERSTTRRTAGERSGCALTASKTAPGDGSACGGNSAACNQAKRSNACGVSFVALLHANHWRELRDVVLGLAWQRPAFHEMFVVARRTRIVGGEKSGRAIAIEHLAEIRGAGENVVMGIAGIAAEAMADA